MAFQRFVPALLVAAAFLVLGTAQRMILLALMHERLATSARDALEALARGARWDLACALAAVAPAALVAAVVGERAWTSRPGRAAVTAAFAFGLAGTAALLTFDALQFLVHAARLEHPLRERMIVAVRILAGQEQPRVLVAVALLASVAGSVLVALLLRPALRTAWKEPVPLALRLRDLVLVVAACVLALAAVPRGTAFPGAPVLDEIAGSSVPALARAAWARAADRRAE